MVIFVIMVTIVMIYHIYFTIVIGKNVVAGVMAVKNGIHDYFNHRDGDGNDHHEKVMLTNDHGRFCDAHLGKSVRDGTAVSCRNVLFARFTWHFSRFFMRDFS